MKMTSNGKTMNYKVIDLVESYNFHIKFTSIIVQTKKLQIFEKRLDPYRRGAPSALLLPWGTAVGPCCRPPRLQIYSFAKFFCGSYIFEKRGKKNVKRKNSENYVILKKTSKPHQIGFKYESNDTEYVYDGLQKLYYTILIDLDMVR
jgi:hypothetical protein